MLGRLLQGRYRIVQVLSAGGFCQTYIAQDTRRLDAPNCVVKHLQLTNNYSTAVPLLRRLFNREAEALKILGKHEQVPQLIAHFEEDQQFYLVQEYIVGHPLSEEVQPGQCWSESQVVHMLQDVLGVLEFVHSHKLIHRDIKPSNLLRRQSDGKIVVIDFGSVKQVLTEVITYIGKSGSITVIGIPATIAIGTPGYMPTEQVRGRPRPNSDIYALGMVAIQALTGVSPTRLLEDADTGELIWQHQNQVSTELVSVLKKMVRYQFQDRYQSATEVLQALVPLANRYSPTQSTTIVVGQRLKRLEATTQLLVTATMPQATSYQQDTMPPTMSEYSNLLFGRKTNVASIPTSPKKFVLLIGLGIGIASALVLMVGSYFALRLTTPTSPSPQITLEQAENF